jgi:hypothetical protein
MSKSNISNTEKVSTSTPTISNLDNDYMYEPFTYEESNFDIYDEPKNLLSLPKPEALATLKKIRKILPPEVNVSLHGGSGTPERFYMQAVRSGVTKVNINSDMRYAFRTTMEKVLSENPDEFAVVKLMDDVKDAVQEVVESKILAFNSKGKARP